MSEGIYEEPQDECASIDSENAINSGKNSRLTHLIHAIEGSWIILIQFFFQFLLCHLIVIMQMSMHNVHGAMGPSYISRLIAL